MSNNIITSSKNNLSKILSTEVYVDNSMNIDELNTTAEDNGKDPELINTTNKYI